MGPGVRRAGRKRDLAPMEATPPTITAGLVSGFSILQIARLEPSLPHADTDRSDARVG
jgi:hypothetical protein